MTEVLFEITGQTLKVTIKGHAGQAPQGRDIVCASVSALAYTLAKAVINFSKRKKLLKKPLIQLSKGEAVIECTPKSDNYNECLLLYNTFKDGYELICNTFPQYVLLKQFGHG